MFLAVTLSPDCVDVAFQMLLIFWSSGKVQPTVHLVRDVDPLVTVTWAWNPHPGLTHAVVIGKLRSGPNRVRRGR